MSGNMKPVKPFAYKECVGCVMNGCYPWSQNPALRCDTMGGLWFHMTSDTEGCLMRREVDFDMWNRYLKGARKEVKYYEEMRLNAMNGKVLSNQEVLW